MFDLPLGIGGYFDQSLNRVDLLVTHCDRTGLQLDCEFGSG